MAQPLPSADQLLGAPSVDELLGPDPNAASPPNQSWSHYPALAGAALSHGLAVGAGLPGDLESLGVRYLVNPIKKSYGAAPEDPNKTFFPTSQDTVNWASQKGLLGTEQPQGEGENLAYGAMSGAASMVPSLMTGGVIGKLPGMVGRIGDALAGRPIAQLAAGAAGGAAGEAAHEALPDNEIAPMLAGAAGGLGVQGLAGLFRPKALTREAAQLGSAQSFQDAGQHLQTAANDWLNSEMPKREAQVWAPVDKQMIGPSAPQGPVTPLTNLTQALTDISGRGGSLAGATKLIRPQLPDRMLTEIQNLPSQPTWQEVRELRSDIGKITSNPKIAQDIGPQNVERMYAAVSEDLRNAAVGQGNKALDAYNQANETSAQLRTLADQHIRPLVDNGVAPQGAARIALAGATNTGAMGGTRLSALRGEMPDAVDELASAHLLQTPQGWARLAPEAKAALVPDGAARNRINKAVAAMGGHDPISDAVHAIRGGEIGAALGVLGNHIVPGVGELTSGAAGELAGLAAPSAFRGAKAVITDPRLTAAGVLGGSNSLFPAP